jgi:hypothetical protein
MKKREKERDRDEKQREREGKRDASRRPLDQHGVLAGVRFTNV